MFYDEISLRYSRSCVKIKVFHKHEIKLDAAKKERIVSSSQNDVSRKILSIFARFQHLIAVGNFVMNNYKFGLVCISIVMQERGYKFRTMTRKRFNDLTALEGREKAIYELTERIQSNLDVTQRIIKYCEEVKIAAYRFSSALFPLITDPTLNLSLEDFDKTKLPWRHYLNKIKETVEKTSVRVSLHPDQFNVLASLNPDTVKKTIKELNFFGWMMNAFGCSQTHWHPMNVHVNLSGKDPAELANIAKRFIVNFEKLDDSVKTKLTLECEDKGLWNAETLYHHFKNTGIPLCFDVHHDLVNPSPNLSKETLFKLYVQTWKNVDPLFHYSESRIGDKNLRAHSDMVNCLPPTHGCTKVYFDIEAKSKDKAIAALMKMSQ